MMLHSVGNVCVVLQVKSFCCSPAVFVFKAVKEIQSKDYGVDAFRIIHCYYLNLSKIYILLSQTRKERG